MLFRRSPTVVLALGYCFATTCCDAQTATDDAAKSEGISAAESTAADGNLIGHITPSDDGPLWDRPAYDYAASIIQEGATRRIWWCGYELYYTDVIYHRSQNLETGEYSPIQRVFAPTMGEAKWDNQFVCDPSVVMGQFFNPDDQRTYAYAMYYTGTEVGAGTNARIGVAFSQDGISWIRYSGNPIIHPQVFPTTTYGAGQAATYNSNGRANIWLFHTDFTPNGESLYMRTTTDGINFSDAMPISTDGVLPGQTVRVGNADLAFDYVGQQWYAVFPYAYDSGRPRPLRPGGKDRERYFFGLYRMPANQFPSGTWERLGLVSTDSTGQVTNHNPALVRDRFGNVNATLPSIEMIFSAGGSNAETWDLFGARWSRNSPRNNDFDRE